MTQIDDAWLEHQQQRWLRPDAHRWLRHGHERFERPRPPEWKTHAQRAVERRQDDPGLRDPRSFASQILALKWNLAALRLQHAMLRHELSLRRKAGFDPGQPRVPAGNPGGGQWTSDGTNLAEELTDISSAGRKPEREPLRITVHPRETSADDGRSLDDAPDIPDDMPATARLRNRVIKEAAVWLAKAALREAANPAIGTFLNVLDAALWIRDAYPYIQAYLDEPKTLDELQAAVSTKRRGYDTHHIVERTPAEKSGYPKSLIDAPENLVSIPTLKHWQITGWFNTLNEDFGGVSPRVYLKDKDWDERMRVGHRALAKFGVLKQ